MEWQPDDTVHPTPFAVRKPGKPNTRPLREILQAWIPPYSTHPEGVWTEPEAHAADPAEPPQAEAT